MRGNKQLVYTMASESDSLGSTGKGTAPRAARRSRIPSISSKTPKYFSWGFSPSQTRKRGEKTRRKSEEWTHCSSLWWRESGWPQSGQFREDLGIWRRKSSVKKAPLCRFSRRPNLNWPKTWSRHGRSEAPEKSSSSNLRCLTFNKVGPWGQQGP